MKENLDDYFAAYTPEFPYHWDEELLLRAYSEKIVQRLGGNNTSLSVLSLGIGGQLVSKTLWSNLNIEKYTVLEGSAQIIDSYRMNNSIPKFLSIQHTYFEDADIREKYDVIEMGFVLEHVDNPKLILEKFFQFLKPGGYLFAAVPNARSLHRLLGNEAGFLNDIYSLSEYDLELGHKRYFDLKTISRLVEECGYIINEKVGLVMKPLATSQLSQLKLGVSVEEAFIKVGYGLPEIANGVLVIATRP